MIIHIKPLYWFFRLRCWLIGILAGNMAVGINMIVEDIYHDKSRPRFYRNIRIIRRKDHWVKIFAKSLLN